MERGRPNPQRPAPWDSRAIDAARVVKRRRLDIFAPERSIRQRSNTRISLPRGVYERADQDRNCYRRRKALGYGWQIALGLANKGLDLAIADIREDWGQEAAETIKAETGRRVIFVKTDVSKRDSVQAMAAKVIAEFGRVDVLVNDAAIDPSQPAEDFTDELFDRIMNINLRGTALCCQAVLVQMRKQQYGRIVNISSGGAVQPVKGLAIYCASKAGVIAYSKVWPARWRATASSSRWWRRG